MVKVIVLVVIILLGIVLLVGCIRQPSVMHNELEGKIIEYLPVTLDDQFELTSGMLYYHYPYGKTDFTEDELMLIYRAIKSFSFYGTSHPWSDEGYIGITPYLNVKNENHETVIFFITHPQWGYLAQALVDDEHMQWFEIDSGAYYELVSLINWGR